MFRSHISSSSREAPVSTAGITLRGALLLLVLLAVSPLEAASESPEAAFDAVKAAIDSGDFRGVVEHVAPSERTMMAFSLDMGVEMASSFWEGDEAKAIQEQFAALRKKHKVPADSDAAPELEVTSDTSSEEIDAHVVKRAQTLFKDVDVPSYVADLLDFFLKSPMMEGQELFPSVELTDVKIEGDHATAQAGDAQIEFLREGGSWYLTAP